VARARNGIKYAPLSRDEETAAAPDSGAALAAAANHFSHRANAAAAGRAGVGGYPKLSRTHAAIGRAGRALTAFLAKAAAQTHFAQLGNKLFVDMVTAGAE
jgi:hypothetical protein